MSVWFAIPSARPPEEANPVLRKWRERGYKIALLRDHYTPGMLCDAQLFFPYPGYSKAVNYLAERILSPNWNGLDPSDPDCQWIVTGGDDIEPDPNHTADEIARECALHFQGTFGVMQPTGDRWGEGFRSKAGEAHIDPICGSPWMGRKFCLEMYQGRGPMWPEYFHMFNDEEMQLVCLKLGVLWQRQDLMHQHQHWSRKGKPAPGFLNRANSRENWDAMKAIFERRKALGFPGHEPLSSAPERIAA